ncbi:A-agglutinin attachment subunit precursor, partial [Escherichia coli]
MRKVAPILKPIAVLTISTIVATTTGIVNSSSYRAPSSSSSTVEE